MSLRLQLNLFITLLLGLMAALLLGLQLDNTRRSVREEVQGAQVVAGQLLNRVNWVYRQGGLEGMREFLHGVGRVRANELQLFDAEGRRLYRSPPSPYKPGREAPAWYTWLVAPPLAPQEIALPGGRLLLQADPSRAVLDGWDELRPLLAAVLAGFALANALAWAWMGRVLRPLQRVAGGLRAVEAGDYASRLPEQGGPEARQLAQAFNRMAQAVQDTAAARQAARAARQALADNQELARRVHARIEEERAAIARELHDELGQQLTAIRSAGRVIERRAGREDTLLSQSARLVQDCAGQIDAGLHRLLSRLRPLALDRLDLGEALHELLDDWRLSHPGTRVTLSLPEPPQALDTLDAARASAVFRIAQEAVGNALRHARARHIAVTLSLQGPLLRLRVEDDGHGRLQDLQAPGRYGVAGMCERAQALGGTLRHEARAGGGLALCATLPLNDAPPPAEEAPCG